MSIKIKVGGVWRNVIDIKVKVNGTWRNVTNIHEKDLLTWKLVYNSGAIVRTINVTDNTNNLNIQQAVGYDGVSLSKPYNITVNIFPQVAVNSSTPTVPAISSGALPPNSSITIINAGMIVGAGGQGGQGGIQDDSDSIYLDQDSIGNGQSGGHAIVSSVDLTIDNTNGYIFAGGGGGGGGALGPCWDVVSNSLYGYFAGGGGGGGGAGLSTGQGAGGPGGHYYCAIQCDPIEILDIGLPGTFGSTGGGSGGVGATRVPQNLGYASLSEAVGGTGGAGGTFGEPGQPGGQGVATGYMVGNVQVGLGGAPGNSVYITGPGTVTWVAGNNSAKVKGPITTKFTNAALVGRGAYANGADSTSYTFSNIPIGTATPDRRVVVCVRGLSLNTTVQHSVTVTIGGIAAQIVLNPTTGVAGATRAIAVCPAPLETTTNITVNTSGACASMLISVYTLTGDQVADIPRATAHAAGTTLSNVNTSIGSVALLMAVNGANASWSGDISANTGQFYQFEGYLATSVALLNESTPQNSTCTYNAGALGVLACIW